MSEQPYKVCDDRKEAVAFAAKQRKLLERRGLQALWKIEIRPVMHARDGYPNYSGPWGVYLIKKG